MASFTDQILLGLTQSIPNSFMQGMNMAERRAAAARAEQARRDALGLKALHHKQLLPSVLSNAEARMMGARNAVESLNFNREKYGNRNEDLQAKEASANRQTLVKKAPGFPEATVVASGESFDPNQLQMQAGNRKVKQVSRESFARGNAETAKKVTQKSLMDEGKIASTGPLSNEDYAAREGIKAKYRADLQRMAQEGRIDLATFNMLNRALLQEGDTSMEGQIRTYAGEVGGPAPAQAPAPDSRTQAKEEYKALIQQGVPPEQAQAQILQKYPGIQ